MITGQLPLGAEQLDLAQFAPDPAAYARALFIEALRRAGVAVSAPLQGPTRPLPPASALTADNKVASLTSPPASVLTKLVTKISHNRGAETLLCLIAVKAGSRTCDEGGMPVVISKFAKAGIDPGTVAIYDGEGSDPASATPAAMTKWLTYIHRQPFAAQFRDGLPDVAHDGKIMAESGLSAKPDVGPMPALFVAAAQGRLHHYGRRQEPRRLAVRAERHLSDVQRGHRRRPARHREGAQGDPGRRLIVRPPG